MPFGEVKIGQASLFAASQLSALINTYNIHFLFGGGGGGGGIKFS